MATKVDFYAVLEVSRTATQEELKKAFRKQALRHHPDRNPGNAEAEHKFKEVNEAYEILKDEQKRAAYDRFGHAAFENGGMGGGGFGGGFSGGGIDDIFEMFGDMMGGRRRPRQRTGADIQVQLEISLIEAFHGITKPVSIQTRVACDACHGSGSADKDGGSTTCPTCQGRGSVRTQQGFFLVERPCPTCQGKGKIIRNPCKQCRGNGTVQKTRSLDVKIPPGIEDGTRIRLPGEGEAGPSGAPSGDLYVHVALKSHDIFQREGANIHCRVPLRLTQAALGTEIEVPVIDASRAKVKIPAGTQSGEHFRLRGKGFSVLRSHARGDMYIQVAVETPRHLSARERELLEEFEREAGENHAKSNPEHSGFFKKVRDFFEGR